MKMVFMDMWSVNFRSIACQYVYYDMRILLSKATVGGLAIFLFFSPSFALADNEIQSIRNELQIISKQLDSTRAQMGDLEKAVYSDPSGEMSATKPVSAVSSSLSNRFALLETRVDEYDSRMRQAFGRFDELTNQVEKISSRLEKLVADIDFRLTGIEKKLSRKSPDNNSNSIANDAMGQNVNSYNQSQNTNSSGTVAVPSGDGYTPSLEPKILGTVSVTQEQSRDEQQISEGYTQIPEESILPKVSAEEQYAHAMSFMQQSEWEKAGNALKAFIEANKGHPLAENAAYWHAESFYARKQFGEAARLYALNYQRFPEGVKAPDNLVKLGLSLVDLRRFPEACQTFEKLGEDFPEMRETLKRAAMRGQSKSNCS
tara:strand:+ start:2756 stop:3874 length:1119 start_codon:yes stop_codon:yes gene_type:complete